jgi:hypothetical protein
MAEERHGRCFLGVRAVNNLKVRFGDGFVKKSCMSKCEEGIFLRGKGTGTRKIKRILAMQNIPLDNN